MKVELFGWVAEIEGIANYYGSTDTKITYVAFLPSLKTVDYNILEKWIMFLQLVEFHLRELNNG